jgi:hypothetical protein
MVGKTFGACATTLMLSLVRTGPVVAPRFRSRRLGKAR